MGWFDFKAPEVDLFGAPRLPGLRYAENFLSTEEERVLIEKIDGSGLTPFRFQQWTGKRLTCSYGWNYDFETGKFAPTEALPEWLMPIRARAAHFVGIPPEDLAQALLICYDPGAGIGWHRDRPVFEHIVGISLGEPAMMRFRQRAGKQFRRATAPLAPRAIYHLSGEARHEWEHSIAPMEDMRWSITFRSLSVKQPNWRCLGERDINRDKGLAKGRRPEMQIHPLRN